ncbi:hypothetical protein F4778DRAFT_713025 [Xylariomycetidae sp. FL2044]|nr:hypothetical protein F4778DRAFT_713025 [Xylariomycetidae sp. FL2044]
MRLYWYAGTSAALATGVVAYAFNQRANFYSAMVYLSQNNLSLMILINLTLLIYGFFVWGLQRLCYGPLRPIEIEQLYEKAWFAVTETCLAMTIFRDEVGAWFLVMFTALVTGKIWEWIGEGRVEILEQQPPANPRLFHTRLSISLALSLIYDAWLFVYAVNSVIQQARPNMMVMFLFEFAILTTCSFHACFRYVLSLYEMSVVKRQTSHRLEERQRQVQEQRADILRRRESDDPAEAQAAEQEELPDEDIDEMDIEVPGWENKGWWILSLDFMIDVLKLGIYSAFFAILLSFYGLPIHIMRDFFLTVRSVIKRAGALLKYRKALEDINRYPDATEEDLAREDTCIVCREDMRPWDPTNVSAVERSRPKKLPCGHILHTGCLKSWLERQQVCPTCRRSVVIDGAAPNGDNAGAGANANQPQAPGNAAGNNGAANPGQPGQGRPNMRVFQLGPIRLGLAQDGPQDIEEMARRLRLHDAGNAPGAAPATPQAPPGGPANIGPGPGPGSGALMNIQAQIIDIANRLQLEIQSLQLSQAQAQTLYAMNSELNRLRQLQPGMQDQQPVQPGINVQFTHQPAAPFPPVAQMPPFLNLGQRINPPAVTRHGGSSYSGAIPAGSQDLPEGVVIPQGWSLLPLQRLDGPPSHDNNLAQDQQQAAPTNDASGSRNVDDSEGPPQAPNRESESQVVQHDTEQHVNTEPRPTPTSSHSEVGAPTPVVPNWGGPAQLFANSGVGGPSSQPQEAAEAGITSRTTSASNAAPEQGGPSTQEESLGSSSKEKAKAVTVEDAEDTEDTDDE